MLSEFVWPLLFWIYVAATLVQLALWWVVFKKLCRRGTFTKPSRFRKREAISLIICARNEACNLQRNLPGVLEQQYPGTWEVIVVDDASSDATPEVLRAFREKYPGLQVVRIDEKRHPGKKQALAAGIAAARYEGLLLTDADCTPASPYWLAHMAAALSAKPETEIVLGYGPLIAPAGGNPAVAAWSGFETAFTAIQYFSWALAGFPYMGVGRNLAFRRQAYEQAGGFRAHLDLVSGDDDLLVNAAARAGNTGICLHPEAFVFSESKSTWRTWARQKHRHLSAGGRYRAVHRFALAVTALSHVLHFFLLAVLLLSGFGMVSVLLLFLARSFSLLFLYGKILPVLRESRFLSRVPIYDTLLAAYYGAFVPLSLIVHRNARLKWK